MKIIEMGKIRFYFFRHWYWYPHRAGHYDAGWYRNCINLGWVMVSWKTYPYGRVY